LEYLIQLLDLNPSIGKTWEDILSLIDKVAAREVPDLAVNPDNLSAFQEMAS